MTYWENYTLCVLLVLSIALMIGNLVKLANPDISLTLSIFFIVDKDSEREREWEKEKREEKGEIEAKRDRDKIGQSILSLVKIPS